MKHIVLRTLLVVLVVLAAASCAPKTPERADTIVFGTPLQPYSLNPITSPDLASRYAIEMLFDGLVAADDRLALSGELATSWDVSADGKEWTFHLRRGVKWHDGHDFSAEDVKFTYDTVLDPNIKPTVSKGDYAAIQKVTVVDPLTVRFSLARPDAAFLSRLVLGIAPRHLLQGQDLATAAFNHNPVGTGPFMFERWSQGDSLALKRNPAYFGTVPKVARIIWKVVPDSGSLALQTMAGDVDGAPVLNMRDIPSLRDSGKVAFFETLEGNTQISLQLNNPLFQDIRVRQALAYGIDTRALIEGVMQGNAVPATSDILPTSWAYDPGVTVYPYDPAKARALLAAAGWNPGADGTLVKDGKPFAITLMTDAGNRWREQVMLAVRQNWSDLGLAVKAETQERNTFVAQRVLKGNFDAVLLQTSVQIEPDISRRFHSASITNGQNFVNYRNAEVDALLDRAVQTTDIEARKAAYSRVQQIMAEELPEISLFHPKSIYAFKREIGGVKPSPLNVFWNAEEWQWR